MKDPLIVFLTVLAALVIGMFAGASVMYELNSPPAKSIEYVDVQTSLSGFLSKDGVLLPLKIELLHKKDTKEHIQIVDNRARYIINVFCLQKTKEEIEKDLNFEPQLMSALSVIVYDDLVLFTVNYKQTK